MQLMPGTAQPRELRHLRLVVDDRPEVPARIAITCLRRQGTIVALAYDRGLAGGAARLDVAIEVSQRHARLLEQRLEQLVEVRELRAR